MRKLWPVTLILLLIAACGELPGTSPAHGPTAGAPRPSAPMPPTDTPIPYPLPPTVPYWLTPEAQPTAMAGPTPIVLGAEWAPESEREVYVSTTVVVAPVGDGPGEIGYWEAPEAGRVWADRFTVDTNGNIYILDKVNRRVARFDPAGHFRGNIPYPPEWSIVNLATDTEGRIFLQERGDGIRLLDQEGSLLQEYARPSWLGTIWDIRVDEQGALWVVADGTVAQAPTIEGSRYSLVTVPLGKAGESLDEGYQKASAVPGFMLFSGQVVLGQALRLYDLEGHAIYELSTFQTVSGVDHDGNLYLLEVRQSEGDEVSFMAKYSRDGLRTSAFGPVKSARTYDYILIDGQGTVHVLALDWAAKAVYRIVRWQRK